MHKQTRKRNTLEYWYYKPVEALASQLHHRRRLQLCLCTCWLHVQGIMNTSTSLWSCTRVSNFPISPTCKYYVAKAASRPGTKHMKRNSVKCENRAETLLATFVDHFSVMWKITFRTKKYNVGGTTGKLIERCYFKRFSTQNGRNCVKYNDMMTLSCGEIA